MDPDKLCRYRHLAGNDYCSILVCKDCQGILLRIGPFSLNLPPDIFHQLQTAIVEAGQSLDQSARNSPGESVAAQLPSRLNRH